MKTFALLFLLLGASQGMAAGPIECFLEAQNRLMSFPRSEMVRLCAGARSTEPVECLFEGFNRTNLSHKEIVDLCAGSGSKATVSCYVDALSNTPLTKPEIIQLCKPQTCPIN